MARKRFNRNSVASSRGNYVRVSHFKLLQEGLEKRGYKEELKDIAEVSISAYVNIPKRYAIKVFGKLMVISKDEAMKLNNELVIRF